MRLFLALAASVLAAFATTIPAAAQSYPTTPVKLIVTTGAGASPDVIARILGDALSKRWSQQVFVTNHPGAAGAIGMKVAGTAPADGHSVLFAMSSSFVALPEVSKGFPYDLGRDFVPIGFVCEQPMAVAVPLRSASIRSLSSSLMPSSGRARSTLRC
jgi:tripartite-type tricarboxylate transporter receptor subunit TctC